MNPNVNALALDGLIPCEIDTVSECLQDVLLEKKESLEVEK